MSCHSYSVRALILLALAFFVGCSASAGSEGLVQDRGNALDTAQLAAYAASSQYPEGAAGDGLEVAAMVDSRDGSVRLVNLSDKPIRDAKVWLNSSFVRPVHWIPSRGSTILQRSTFYDASASGMNMAAGGSMPVRVELEMDDKLYRVDTAHVDSQR